MKKDMMTGLWTPPAINSGLRPASKNWHESSEKVALDEIRVAYAGGVVIIEKDSTYYVDSKDRVLIGWHESYNPPPNVDGDLMVEI